VGYTKNAIKGVSWIAVLRASTRVISFLKTIILARILVPSQFGAYGVALLVLGFLEVMTETGVNVLLIQEKEIDKYINSAWIVSIVRGIIISTAIILLTPFIANFFNSQEAKPLLYAMSLVPFLRGFINPSVVKFQKQLNFNMEFRYRFIIFFIDSVVAIGATLIIHNPMGIVIGLVAGVVVEVLLSYKIIQPTPFFQFNRNYIMKIVHRGKWITASGVFNYLFHNADNIVVGRLLGTNSLGVYQIAYSLSILPITEIADVFSRVTFPVYAKIVGDKERLRRAFIKTTVVIALLAIPFGLLLYLFPKDIVLLVLGKKWIAAAPILPILGIFGVIRAISGSNSALFLASGKQEYVTVVTLASFLGLMVPIVPLVQHYGLYGAAISALIGTLVALPFFLYYIWKIFK
jgi:O-antigen/teichoic acid export membrane protein